MQKDAIWYESLSEEIAWFVCVVKMYTEKTASPWKVNATTAYPKQLKLLKFLAELTRYLIYYGYTLAIFFSFFMSELSNGQWEAVPGL